LSLPEIIVLALALAVDAFTVGAAVGLRHGSPRQIFRLSFHFGLFQALMPLLGILIGKVLNEVVEAFDHWLAFGLLAFVGGRMIYTALRGGEEEEAERDLTRGASLVILSLAVSIDALAVGFSIGVSEVPFALPVILIGVIAAAMTVLGMLLANRIGGMLGRGAEIVAGVVLIGIGVKVLVEGLS
jgi:putative Mn2+ efflux pump MntP